jgi:hypothetical protein
MAKHTIDELNQLYTKGVEVDQSKFAEQRSNVMIISGQHYNSKNNKHWDRIRDSREVPGDMKLRLTKNHAQKVAHSYLNHLVGGSPGVKIIPRNEKEIQDQKAAELNQSVWAYSADQLKFSLKTISLAKDYVDLGESAIKIFWNPYGGKFKGYEQAVDPLTGQPAVDEMGQLTPDPEKPIFEGRLEIEKLLATNLFRDANATSIEESPFLGIRKMVPYEDLKKMFDPDKLSIIETSQREEYMVFEPNSASYNTVKGQVLVKEYYFRPCVQYPEGYFYITTTQGILFEDKLPFGIFPIEYVGWDETQSSARHSSVIKQIRPYQIEINRTASKIAEHQVTSDDKILIQNGTKISSGGVLPGVRAIQYSGIAPTVLEGRAGSQYVDYMNSQIAELYQITGLVDEMEKASPTSDPYGLLFRSVKEKKKFSIYITKFELYLKSIVEKYLALAKHYLNEDALIPMIGKTERVNIAEFKSTQEIFTQIKVMPMSEDVDTMFGKWLAINHALQFVGGSLEKDDIGRLMKQVPFGNFDESFGDFTLGYELANNFILALERNERPEPSAADDKPYMIKRLENRIRMSDFKFLDPQIQELFLHARDGYQAMDVQEKLAIQRAQQGFIPTSGPLIKTDLQTSEPNSTGGVKTTRAAFPVDALSWLQKQLESQGTALTNIEDVPQSAQAAMGTNFSDELGLPNTPPPDLMESLRSQNQQPGQNQTAQGAPNGLGNTNPTRS